MSLTKPKAVLETQLDEQQQAQLAEWLLSGMPYHKARELVADQFGVRVSLGAFSGFWDRVCSSALIARRRRAVSAADTIRQEAEARPGAFDVATLQAIQTKALELSINPACDPAELATLFKLILKARDQDLEERRVQLLEARAAQADEAQKAIKNEALTPEERDARLKQIFGL